MGFLKDAAGGIIEGAFGLGGAALQSSQAGKASEAQERSAREALAFQREQAAKAEAAYKQRWLENQAMRAALLKRYGIDIPELQGMAPMGDVQQYGAATGRPVPMGQGGPPVGAAPGKFAPQGMPPRGAGLTLGEMAMRRPFYEWNPLDRG